MFFSFLTLTTKACNVRIFLPPYGQLLAKTMSTSSTRKAPKIYTKTGDKGTSALFSGERRNKDDRVFEALGTVDELSCTLGCSLAHLAESASPELSDVMTSQLTLVQSVLQEVGSAIATPPSSARPAHLKRLAPLPIHSHTQSLEGWIDTMTAALPPLTNFILPSGGGHASSSLHLARAVCRRTERCLVPLVADGDVGEELGVFVNRLSDCLFTMARFAALKSGGREAVYRPTVAPGATDSTKED